MDFTQYIRNQRGNATQIANALGVGNAYISQLASGYRTISPVRAVQIEMLTNGLVTRQELRPNDWHLLWPELIKSSKRHPKSAHHIVNQSPKGIRPMKHTP
jgi:DNA-binding transcriptional regulator YdaS (Cro superfamily)